MNEVLTAGFGVSHKGVGLSVNTMHDGTTITFTSGDIIKDILTDPRITNNGKSVGERNIESVSYTHLTLPTNREV